MVLIGSHTLEFSKDYFTPTRVLELESGNLGSRNITLGKLLLMKNMALFYLSCDQLFRWVEKYKTAMLENQCFASRQLFWLLGSDTRAMGRFLDVV